LVIRFALNATTTSRESRQVNPWTQSNLNHQKHHSDAFMHSFIFSIILFRKYKNIFTFLHTQLKPRNTITAAYLFYCIVIYFIVLHIIFYFYLLLHLVFDNHSEELGTQDKEIFLQVAWRRTSRAFLTVPREFDIKPWVLSWGKFTLATTLYTWSPDELTPLLCVINHPKFLSNCIKTTWIHHLDLGVSDSSLGLHLLRIGLRLDLFKRDLALLGLSELLPLGFFELMLLLNQCQFAFHKYW
jgi:hypothetical protein